MLDYTLQNAADRAKLVQEILDTSSPDQLTNKYLDILSDYVIYAMTKEEKREKKILTENRMVTVNKRETSYQGLVNKFENGEDGVYNLITDDRNILLTPKISITAEDLAEIQPLRELKEAIEAVEKAEKNATGKKKFLLKKQLIEMRQSQYIIKSDFKNPIQCGGAVKGFIRADLEDNISVCANGEPRNDGILSFFNPKHVSALLCNYAALKEEAYGNFINDAWYMMEDLDNLIEHTLKDNYPLYYDILIYKIDGRQNIEIQKLLEYKYGMTHSIEYLSSLWRNKIPKLIAEEAKKEYLVWHYSHIEKGKWKRCSKCGKLKLAHNKFFSKNQTSKDGFYSICKDCRSKKGKTE